MNCERDMCEHDMICANLMHGTNVCHSFACSRVILIAIGIVAMGRTRASMLLLAKASCVTLRSAHDAGKSNVPAVGRIHVSFGYN